MTYPAGIAVANSTGKPLVIHVHSTEFDRSGEHVNQMIYDIERAGMNVADKIIAVSYFTRNIIISRYGIPATKSRWFTTESNETAVGLWPLQGLDGMKRLSCSLAGLPCRKALNTSCVQPKGCWRRWTTSSLSWQDLET